MNFDAVVTREPGGAPGAELIRGLLVNGAIDKWNPFTETLLHITARHDHVENMIRPALLADKWVVCDRFLHSTRAYQGYGQGQDLNIIDALHEIALWGLHPDLTIILDLDPEIGLKRAFGRGDENGTRYESMGVDFHQRIRSGFLEMAKQSSESFLVIDASQEIEAIALRVKEAVRQRFSIDI